MHQANNLPINPTHAAMLDAYIQQIQHNAPHIEYTGNWLDQGDGIYIRTARVTYPYTPTNQPSVTFTETHAIACQPHHTRRIFYQETERRYYPNIHAYALNAMASDPNIIGWDDWLDVNDHDMFMSHPVTKDHQQTAAHMVQCNGQTTQRMTLHPVTD